MPNEKEYLIIEKSYSYAFCHACGGSGIKTRTFRGQKFVENCSSCSGTGRQRLTKTTEVPLLEALKELKLIK